jgi:hypothetical protein
MNIKQNFVTSGKRPGKSLPKPTTDVRKRRGTEMTRKTYFRVHVHKLDLKNSPISISSLALDNKQWHVSITEEKARAQRKRPHYGMYWQDLLKAERDQEP